jgi:hypothetical protein
VALGLARFSPTDDKISASKISRTTNIFRILVALTRRTTTRTTFLCTQHPPNTKSHDPKTGPRTARLPLPPRPHTPRRRTRQQARIAQGVARLRKASQSRSRRRRKPATGLQVRRIARRPHSRGRARPRRRICTTQRRCRSAHSRHHIARPQFTTRHIRKGDTVTAPHCDTPEPRKPHPRQPYFQRAILGPQRHSAGTRTPWYAHSPDCEPFTSRTHRELLAAQCRSESRYSEQCKRHRVGKLPTFDIRRVQHEAGSESCANSEALVPTEGRNRKGRQQGRYVRSSTPGSNMARY